MRLTLALTDGFARTQAVVYLSTDATARGTRCARRVDVRSQAERGTHGDIVQEAWVGVLAGIDRFEGRSSLRTWVVSILNVARRHAVKDAPAVPLSSLGPADDGG